MPYYENVLIAGGGIIGLSCAWRLAQRGISVTLFDAGAAGGEASWAGAGMLAPGGEVDAASPLATLALRSLAAFPEFVRELCEETGCSIDYRRSGAMELAPDDAEAESLTEVAVSRAALGIPSEACRFNGFAARFYPEDAIVDPRQVTHALVHACRRRGVDLREHEPVQWISPDGAALRTPSREYRNSGVLIAAGAWSSDLLPGLPRTMPVRGHLLAFKLNPGALDPILRRQSTYLLQRRSGLLLAGSSTEHVGFDRAIDESVVADIHRRASQLFPVLASQTPLERWNGFRPGIDAPRPAIGRIPGTSVWTAFGHYRNGILLAPETARLISESVS